MGINVFKISAIAVITAVVFGCVEGQQFGLCTMDEIMQKNFHCLTAFTHSLQKNPNSDCSDELKGVRDCFMKHTLACVPESARSNAKIKIARFRIEKVLTKKRFCDQAGIFLPDDQTVEGKLTLKALCDITMPEYTAIFNRCLKPVVNMWQANKADKRLCGEYTKADKCWKKAVFDDRKCVPADPVIIKRKIEENYNPFCPDGRDPGIVHQVVQHPHSVHTRSLFSSFL